MATQGNILANYRYNPITQAEVPETITAEVGTVAELTELASVYGFELRECPQSSPAGVTTVTRDSDAQVFTYVATAPGANEYFIDYTNNSPVLIFNATEDTETFTVVYEAVGAPDSVRNTQLIAATAGNIEAIMKSYRVTSFTTAVDVTKTISGKHASVFNCSVATTKTLTVDSAIQGIGVLSVFGDLTLTGTAILSLKRILLIVYGNILGSGSIRANPLTGGAGGNGGAGGGPPGAAGSTGTTLATEYGGSGGTGGTGGIGAGVGGGGGGAGVGGGGGGGGGGGDGGGGSAGLTGSTAVALSGGGGGGGGGGSAFAGGGGSAGSGGSGGYFLGAGGNGGSGGTAVGVSGGGGGGGGSGGAGLVIICFGTIANTITIQTGTGGAAGSGVGGGSSGSAGSSGSLHLFSQYTSNPFGTVTIGSGGSANYNSLDRSDVMGLLNDLTLNTAFAISNAAQIGYLYSTKQGTTF